MGGPSLLARRKQKKKREDEKMTTHSAALFVMFLKLSEGIGSTLNKYKNILVSRFEKIR